MPQNTQPCVVPGCPNHAHAKGYCRRHYGQMWRRGMIYEPGSRRAESEAPTATGDELRGLERDLATAKSLYDTVVGLERRLYWRRKIASAQESLRLLQARE